MKRAKNIHRENFITLLWPSSFALLLYIFLFFQHITYFKWFRSVHASYKSISLFTFFFHHRMIDYHIMNIKFDRRIPLIGAKANSFEFLFTRRKHIFNMSSQFQFVSNWRENYTQTHMWSISWDHTVFK